MRFSGWIVAGVLLMAVRAWGLGEKRYVSMAPVQGGFVLYTSEKAAPLVVSDSDWPGVVRAVGDLSADVGRVTRTSGTPGKNEGRMKNEGGKGADVVLIGTIGKSPLIDALVKTKKLDVSGIAGQWESAVTTIVQRPMPGVKRAGHVVTADSPLARNSAHVQLLRLHQCVNQRTLPNRPDEHHIRALCLVHVLHYRGRMSRHPPHIRAQVSHRPHNPRPVRIAHYQRRQRGGAGIKPA